MCVVCGTPGDLQHVCSVWDAWGTSRLSLFRHVCQTSLCIRQGRANCHGLVGWLGLLKPCNRE